MPSVSKEYDAKYLAPVMNFVANWRLNSKFGLCTNWILVYSGNNEVPTGKYFINFNFPFNDKWSGFVENYGQLRNDVFETRFDAGLAYLANNNVQFDVYVGYGDNFGIRDFFGSAGISWRLNFNKK